MSESYHLGNTKTHQVENQRLTEEYQLFKISPGLSKINNIHWGGRKFNLFFDQIELKFEIDFNINTPNQLTQKGFQPQ